MDMWSFFFLSLALILTLSHLLSKYIHRSKRDLSNLPPGPSSLIFFAKLIWQKKRLFVDTEPLRQLSEKYGPIISLRIGALPFVFILDRQIAHQALIQMGGVFSDRPRQREPLLMFTNNQHTISSSNYGPYWRLLRRNMALEIMQPSRMKRFAPARSWALQILLDDLRAQSETNGGIVITMESFKYAVFCLLVFMCFGEKLDKASIKEIHETQHSVLTALVDFPFFAVFPKITKRIFQKKWQKLVSVQDKQREIFLRLIRDHEEQKDSLVSYADTLLNLRIPEESGKDYPLTNGDIVALCSEFLNGGTDTTATAVEWIMAELVKRPDVQTRLYDEIRTLIKDREEDEEFITEEELKSLPYLKAVVMEGLRRHPPGHVVLPHTVTEDTKLEGYLIPKGSSINFMVAEMAWDEKEWEDPLEFKPERFLEGKTEKVDITGTKEIKMMPFGVGRRMCPGYSLALLHLECFVGNLVREFEWKPVEGEEIDMSEKFDFTVAMKNPLRAVIVPRR
ncbi:hypothetical protein LUZ60_007265 [Juncus effusus]|nr:hypothetical protein LUZ60_007265 [Juncus effusus]